MTSIFIIFYWKYMEILAFVSHLVNGSWQTSPKHSWRNQNFLRMMYKLTYSSRKWTHNHSNGNWTLNTSRWEAFKFKVQIARWAAPYPTSQFNGGVKPSLSWPFIIFILRPSRISSKQPRKNSINIVITTTIKLE